MKWMIVLLAVASLAAGPVTRPGVVDSKGQSTDGVDFPAVTFPQPNQRQTEGSKTLRDAYDLMLCPPAGANLKIFNADKSAAMLRSRTTYRVGSNTKTMPTKGDWFSVALAGADISSFTVAEGVITEITLFYKKGDVGNAMLNKEYPRYGTSPWTWRVMGHSLLIRAEVAPVPWYLAHHPEIKPDVRQAMLQGVLIRGMSIEQAQECLGAPISITDSGNEKIYQWRRGGELQTGVFANGVASTISRTAD